jgi:hypothetical protein
MVVGDIANMDFQEDMVSLNYREASFLGLVRANSRRVLDEGLPALDEGAEAVLAGLLTQEMASDGDDLGILIDGVAKEDLLTCIKEELRKFIDGAIPMIPRVDKSVVLSI